MTNQLTAADEKMPVVAWLEHHKAGDNLEWDCPGGKCSALVRQSDAQAAVLAAYEAGKATAVPPGYRLVPAEPTDRVIVLDQRVIQETHHD